MRTLGVASYRRGIAVIVSALSVAAGLQCQSSTTTLGIQSDDAGSAGTSSTGGSTAAGSDGGGSTASGSTGTTASQSGSSRGPDGGAPGVDGAAPPDGASNVLDATAFGPDGACECRRYWCGCGICDPSQIACTASPTAICARGCNSSCPEYLQTTCGCDSQGRCVRSGIDAAGIGCMLNVDCPPGLCCSRSVTAQDLPGSCMFVPNASCN
jgi:hypothetical protein